MRKLFPAGRDLRAVFPGPRILGMMLAVRGASIGGFARAVLFASLASACGFDPLRPSASLPDAAPAAADAGSIDAAEDSGFADASDASDAATSSTADGGDAAIEIDGGDAAVADLGVEPPDGGDAAEPVPDAGADGGVDSGAPDSGVPFAGYTPSNFDPAMYPGPHLDWTIAGGDTCVIETGTPGSAIGCGLPSTSYNRVTMIDGSIALMVAVNDLRLEAGGNLVVYGDAPVIVAVYGSAVIDGQVDADALGGYPGAGAIANCPNGQGRSGGLARNNRGGGGGGAGFALSGGNGGSASSGSGPGGMAGLIDGDATLIPLRGGCSGGDGAGPGGGRGAGGGAIQISASGALVLAGRINAVGGGGDGGGIPRGGGGGGGSGGAVLLEGGALSITETATIAVPGGGGGEGGDNQNNGESGRSGSISQVIISEGGDGQSFGGDGGDGGGLNQSALPGGNGTNEAGGGGGGSAGRIRLHSNTPCTPHAEAAISGQLFVDCP